MRSKEPDLKMSTRITKENAQMAHEHTKKDQLSFGSGHHYTPLEQTTNTKRSCRSETNRHVLLVGMPNVTGTSGSSWHFPFKKVKHTLLIWSSHPIPRYSLQTKACALQMTHTQTFPTAFLVLVNDPIIHQRGEWINYSISTHRQSPATKDRGLYMLQHDSSPEIIISKWEKRQRKNEYCMVHIM